MASSDSLVRAKVRVEIVHHDQAVGISIRVGWILLAVEFIGVVFLAGVAIGEGREYTRAENAVERARQAEGADWSASIGKECELVWVRDLILEKAFWRVEVLQDFGWTWADTVGEGLPEGACE